jgi:peptide deformylase
VVAIDAWRRLSRTAVSSAPLSRARVACECRKPGRRVLLQLGESINDQRKARGAGVRHHLTFVVAHDEQVVGLAALQVGVSSRICAISLCPDRAAKMQLKHARKNS